jgi:hypothetical protein
MRLFLKDSSDKKGESRTAPLSFDDFISGMAIIAVAAPMLLPQITIPDTF